MTHNPYWNAKNGARPWAKEDDEKLLRLAKRGMVYREIGAALGRSTASIRFRIRLVDADHEARPAKDYWTSDQVELAKKLIAEKADRSTFKKLVGHTFEQTKMKFTRLAVQERAAAKELPPPAIIVPPEVIEERNRRLMADRDLTAMLMGDPPRGYSALERRA